MPWSVGSIAFPKFWGLILLLWYDSSGNWLSENTTFFMLRIKSTNQARAHGIPGRSKLNCREKFSAKFTSRLSTTGVRPVFFESNKPSRLCAAPLLWPIYIMYVCTSCQVWWSVAAQQCSITFLPIFYLSPHAQIVTVCCCCCCCCWTHIRSPPKCSPWSQPGTYHMIPRSEEIYIYIYHNVNTS